MMCESIINKVNKRYSNNEYIIKMKFALGDCMKIVIWWREGIKNWWGIFFLEGL